MVENPHLEGIKAKLKELSDADPLGFRKAAAWDAFMADPNLAEVRKRLSADHIQRIFRVVIPAAMGAHDWFIPDFIGYECCRNCGIVKRLDGPNKPCKGRVGVGPRNRVSGERGGAAASS